MNSTSILTIPWSDGHKTTIPLDGKAYRLGRKIFVKSSQGDLEIVMETIDLAKQAVALIRKECGKCTARS